MKGLKLSIEFIITIFGVYILQLFFPEITSMLGVVPRDWEHLLGILTMPLLHGSWQHLINNAGSIILLIIVLFNSYPRVAWWVFNGSYVFPGIFIWFLGNSYSVHIGCSGLVYGIAFFLIGSGFFRKDAVSILISLFIVLFNSGLLAGLLPFQIDVSWQGHLGGALIGLYLAYLFRNIDRVEKPIFFKRTPTEKTRYFEKINEE